MAYVTEDGIFLHGAQGVQARTLEHSGVKGMKWGFSKNRKNGKKTAQPSGYAIDKDGNLKVSYSKDQFTEKELKEIEEYVVEVYKKTGDSGPLIQFRDGMNGNGPIITVLSSPKPESPTTISEARISYVNPPNDDDDVLKKAVAVEKNAKTAAAVASVKIQKQIKKHQPPNNKKDTKTKSVVEKGEDFVKKLFSK